MRSTLSLLVLLSPLLLSAQLNPQPVQIPMRDGKTLAADVYLPSDIGVYPTVLIQTPYNKNTFRLYLPLNVGFNISTSPFAFVVADWRCFYASASACGVNINRGQDGYDIVEWIAQQSWSNGKVGTWGPSALGNIQFSTAREHPPHLVCAVPMVASPETHYEQYYPGGVALPEYLATLGTLFGDAFSLVPQNPYYNLVWQIAENASYYPDELDIPMLHIGGWFDHNTEDVLAWFQAMRETSPAGSEQWLLMGPWTHGGTGLSAIGTSMQGELDFPEAANTNNDVAIAFLRHYLLEENNGWDMNKPVMYFQMGVNTWLQSVTFPPAKGDSLKYYLREDASLSLDSGISATSISYTYDPEDPSPTVGGKTLSVDLDQGPYDQSILVESRSDNILFTTPVLTSDITVQGQISVTIYLSSDRPDTDVDIRLTEVYPDGRSIALGQIAKRMRFRTGYTAQNETFMQPGQVYPVTLLFDNLAQTFKAGNRIRIIVTSSNYPWFNRNMNNGMEMYPENNLDTVVNPIVAHNVVHVQGQYPSRVVLPIVSEPLSVDHSRVEALDVTPNPADSYVVIKSIPENSILNIRSVDGRRYFQKSCTGDTSVIPVSALPSGIYLLEIVSSTRRAVTRLIIQH